MTARERAVQILDAARRRADVKRLASELDGDPELRMAVWEEGRRRGVALEEAALDWSARRLLRVARGRSAEAQRRRNPIHVDEGFDCAHCGKAVPPHGRTARNHCPWCLRSVHVDVVPGDRAADCGGILDPVRMELAGGTPTLTHVCRRCRAERRVRVLRDGDVPDDWSAVIKLSAGEAP